jgi:hypothetical protein
MDFQSSSECLAGSGSMDVRRVGKEEGGVLACWRVCVLVAFVCAGEKTMVAVDGR